MLKIKKKKKEKEKEIFENVRIRFVPIFKYLHDKIYFQCFRSDKNIRFHLMKSSTKPENLIRWISFSFYLPALFYHQILRSLRIISFFSQFEKDSTINLTSISIFHQFSKHKSEGHVDTVPAIVLKIYT